MKQLFLLTAFFFSLACVGQKYNISGYISEKGKKEFIPGVQVYLDGNYVCSSKVDGEFSFYAEKGKHVLVFKQMGFQELIKEINLDDDFHFKIELEVGVTEIDQVVISAGKFEQNISDVSISMEVLDSKLIENNNITSLDKMVEQSPGVSIINGQANIRGGGGFSYGAGSRVLLLIDGVPTMRAGAGDIMWDYLPTENVDKVEVLKGASSVIYGSSALNGVINIITGNPKKEPVTKVVLYTGWYDDPPGKATDYYIAGENHPIYNGASFMHSRKIGNNDFVISGNVLSDDGYLISGSKQRARLDLKTKFRVKQIEGLSFGLSGNAQYSDIGQFIMWDNDTSGFYKPRGDREGRFLWRQWTFDPSITYMSPNGKNKFTYKSKTFFVDTSGTYYNEIQYQRKIKFKKKYKLVITPGIVSNYMDVSTEEFGAHVSNNFSVYLQNDLDLDRLKISGGARYETFVTDAKELVETTLFRGGLNYRLFKNTNLRGSYGQGFRYPSIGERFIRYSAEPLEVYPNDTLQPEKGETIELAVRQAFKIKKWKGYVDLAAFWSQYKNMIEFEFGQWGNFSSDPFFGLGFRSINRSKAIIKGFELSFGGTGKIKNVQLNAMLGYTYIYPLDFDVDQTDTSFVKDDEILKYRFEHTGKASVQIIYKKFSSGLNFRYNSFMKNIDPVFETSLPGMGDVVPGLSEFRAENNKGDWVWDVNIGYQVSKSSKFSIVLKNLVNRQYTIRPALPEQPRTIAIQYSGKF